VLATTGCLPKLDTRTPPVETAALAPEFELNDTSGATHRLSDLIADGPAVVVFYRGYW
jgi:peroxiredoxin